MEGEVIVVVVLIRRRKGRRVEEGTMRGWWCYGTCVRVCEGVVSLQGTYVEGKGQKTILGKVWLRSRLRAGMYAHTNAVIHITRTHTQYIRTEKKTKHIFLLCYAEED